ncbi:energy transducer TonB (plasmid) [Bernardetia sp. Wsw4-3y2]|uniref:energy transducer TonB n=1 Tax=Bernardetia sp. Wsw4-3y2 TaxID=3127471 RepID=UPI0030D342E1
MAMLIIFTIFGLFWLGTTLASITYMVFKNSKSLTQKLEDHPPFWLQDYYAFLNRYHKPLLIGSIVMGIGLTVWGINSQEEKTFGCQMIDPNYTETRIIIKRRGCNKNRRKENTYIERSATPYGGTENLYRYLSTNQNNPTHETGTIYVQFFVQEDGSLADISVLSSVSPTLDNEAIRLIEEYTEGWKPALYHGRAVEQRVVIPVQF